MTDQLRRAAQHALDGLEWLCRCPCCEGVEACVEGCTYEEDARGWVGGTETWEQMRDSRAALAPLREAMRDAGPLTHDEIEYLRHGRYIEAVKAVRARLGWGLRDAKDYVDEHGSQHRPVGR